MIIQLFSPDHLALEMIEHLEQVQQSPVSLAIPGGRSPGKVLGPLAQQCPESLRARLHLFWVDERSVPLGHADRNDLSTLSDWTNHGKAPYGVHPMPAELDNLQEAGVMYKNKLHQLGFQSGMHLTLLGIGEDGHFASLFPNHLGLEETKDVFFIENSPKPPPRRLSFSLPYILKSRRIDVLVFGKDKGLVIEQARKESSKNLPVSLLMEHPNIVFHLDREALSQIKTE
jgi:6-phosphogluconolactonase